MNTQIQDTATPTGEPVDKVLERPQPVSFRQAFWFWLKLGFISFGGPAGQIAIMHTELVERRRWISERRFLHALNYCMLLPAGGAAARNLYRMAAASDLGRNRRGRPVCPAVAVYPHRTVLGLCRLGRCARHCRPVPWHQAGRDRHRPIRGPSHRIARAEKPRSLEHRSRGVRRDLRDGVAVPADCRDRGIDRLRWRSAMARYFQVGSRHGSNSRGYGPALIDDDTPRQRTPDFAGAA